MCENESLRSMMCIMCVIWNVNVLFLVLLPFYTLFELVVPVLFPSSFHVVTDSSGLSLSRCVLNSSFRSSLIYNSRSQPTDLFPIPTNSIGPKSDAGTGSNNYHVYKMKMQKQY